MVWLDPCLTDSDRLCLIDLATYVVTVAHEVSHVALEALARAWGVTPATARRRLERLVTRGLVVEERYDATSWCYALRPLSEVYTTDQIAAAGSSSAETSQVKSRNLRKEAISLFRISKKAFRFIRDRAPDSDDRAALLKELREVIDRADPPSFDEDLSMLTLTMTPPTYSAIVTALKDRREDADALEAVVEGTHETKQRVYVKLDLNHVILRKLHFVLVHKATQPQAGSFKRLAKDVEKAMERNPMEILGRMAL